MKKQSIVAVIALAMAICMVLLSGCSFVKGLEKEVQVTLIDRGTTVGTYTVSTFSNAVVTAELAPPQDGYMLAGWSPKQDWSQEKYGEDYLTSNKTVIRYAEIKDYIDGNGNVTLYAAYMPIPQHDLVIAWYDKESTSGINQQHMDAFKEKLYEFLTNSGYTPDTMDIVIRGYQGDVGTTCSAIMNDKDVHIMVGWNTTSNLVGTGGMTEGKDFIENKGGVTIGTKERYAARLVDDPLVNLVYDWIFVEYGPEPLTDEETVAQVKESLVLRDSYISDFTLPISALATVTWTVTEGTAIEIVDGTAKVTRSEEDQTVKLKATITLNNVTDTKEFTVTVPGTSGEVKDTDVVIAWYSKTDTSGISQADMDAFKTALEQYLTTQGYNVSELTITIRGYDGKVGETCAAIMADGDVDIMVGWSTTSNLTGTGGMVEGTDFIENNGGVTIGTKERYAARLTDTELGNLVYQWIFAEYGPAPVTDEQIVAEVKDGLALKSEYTDNFTLPTSDKATVTWEVTEGTAIEIVDGTAVVTRGETDQTVKLTATITLNEVTDTKEFVITVPAEGTVEPVDTDIVIAWYAKEKTSGINQGHMDAFKTTLEAYLTSQGYNIAELTITIRAYGAGETENGVAETCAAIKADGDVDIMIGWSSTSNLTGTGGMVEGVDFIENNDGVTVGTKERYAARLTDTTLVNLVYDWLFVEYGPEPVEPDPQTELVIGWYAKTSTSGLDQTIIDKFASGLNTYLQSQGYTTENLTVTFKAYDGVVADVQNAVIADGNVCLMLGMKAFEVPSIIDVQENVAMGVKTDRRIHLLDDGVVSKLVFEWLKTEEAKALLV